MKFTRREWGFQAAVVVLLAAVAMDAGQPLQMPMPVPFADSAEYRWLGKTVRKSRLLDGMEDLENWTQRATFGYGEPFEPRAEVALSTAHVKDGRHSLRLRCPTIGDKPGPQMGRPFGTESVIRRFDGEDWRDFNRLSFWVYPDLPGFHTVSLLASFHNDGEIKIPGRSDVTPGLARLGLNFLVVENHRWNHVVWEIPDLPRDRVIGVEFQYRLQGHEPGATETAVFYFDSLELQRIEQTDHYEGWDVAPGRIAYSHSGYQPGARKTAIASDLEAEAFDLIDQATGEAVLTRSVSRIKTHLGEYQLLDFSEVRRPGEYTLRAGDRITRPFRIHSDIWTDTLWKAINYFYCQRCGDAIPGIHDVCHRDWLGVHGDKQVVINGGWHDAGDTCQGLANTGETVYAMLSLAERLKRRGEHPELTRRVMEEARWGLEWVLKTQFGDGFRITWATHDFWTNGIIGDVDDVTAAAQNDPGHNYVAAAAEALAARLYRESDPTFAELCLERARADWRFASEGSFSGRYGSLKGAAAGVLASLDLYRATGEEHYAGAAARQARSILDHQQRKYFRELDVPLAGFFWESTAREFMLHEAHLGGMHGPLLVLVRLCEALPNHPDWIRWYSGVVLYSEFLKATAAYTEPYRMVPESLYREDEHFRIPEDPRADRSRWMPDRKNFQEQVLNGIKLGPRYRLRAFPVWSMFRGNHGIILPKAKALATAAHLRGDLDSAGLAENQLQWAVGRNPFGQSTMTGEGHDFVPHYSAMSGDIVGSLPVGIETYRNRDVPYWPVHNHMNTKETWVLPVAHWIWIMRDLAGPGLVSGRADAGVSAPVRFTDKRTGDTIEVTPEPATGAFRAWLPQGAYQVSRGDRSTSLTVLPAATVELDLRSGRFLDLVVSRGKATGGGVELRITVTGSGRHRITLRADNVRFQTTEQAIDLGSGETRTIIWNGTIDSAGAPWVVVAVPDDDVSRRQEIIGIKFNNEEQAGAP